MPLTPQQETAVYDRGGSLLVSAAAGSGKTKVLVERLFSYMEQEGCQVDDFLIITYTKAAAAWCWRTRRCCGLWSTALWKHPIICPFG